jgi:hypothetical protein
MKRLIAALAGGVGLAIPAAAAATMWGQTSNSPSTGSRIVAISNQSQSVHGLSESLNTTGSGPGPDVLGGGLAAGADSTASLQVKGGYRATLPLDSTAEAFPGGCWVIRQFRPGLRVYLIFGSSKMSAALRVTLFRSGPVHNLDLAKTGRGYVTLHRYTPGADWFAGAAGTPGQHYGSGTLSLSDDLSSGSLKAVMPHSPGSKRVVHVVATWHCSASSLH